MKKVVFEVRLFRINKNFCKIVYKCCVQFEDKDKKKLNWKESWFGT